MMRLIDADAIKYTMLYKENFMARTGTEKQGVWKSEIDKMPTVDAVPVIRCKDCKYYEEGYMGRMICIDDGVCRNDDDYCSSAERKEE